MNQLDRRARIWPPIYLLVGNNMSDFLISTDAILFLK